MIQKKNKGLIAIVSANTIFGLNIPVTKALVAQWMSPMVYTATRMFFGALVFWIIGSFMVKEKVNPKDLLIMFVGGLLGYLSSQFLFSQSLEYTTPVIFSLIMALTPIVVLLLSAIFLKEKISSRKITGIVLSISGAALIILLGNNNGVSGNNNTLGILYAMLCVLGYAIYLVITRSISVKYSPVTVAKYMFLFSALVILPLSFNKITDQKIYSEETTMEAISLIAFALLFSTSIALFLMPYALKRLEASTVSIFMNLQPIVASVVAIIVGQDSFTWDKPFAVVLVVIGVYLVTLQKNKIRHQPLIFNNIRKIKAQNLSKR